MKRWLADAEGDRVIANTSIGPRLSTLRIPKKDSEDSIDSTHNNQSCNLDMALNNYATSTGVHGHQAIEQATLCVGGWSDDEVPKYVLNFIRLGQELMK